MPPKSENSVLKSIIRKGLGFKFPSSVIKQCNEAFLVERTYETKVRHCINCCEGMEMPIYPARRMKVQCRRPAIPLQSQDEVGSHGDGCSDEGPRQSDEEKRPDFGIPFSKPDADL